jgi:hypothetical protein
LIEGAHSYRYNANISTEIQKRQEGLPKAITDIAWQAQLRLCRRYQRLSHKGKHYNVLITAIAREMVLPSMVHVLLAYLYRYNDERHPIPLPRNFSV